MHYFQKPENALKRANELRAIGANDEALQILHAAIGHRFFRIQGWDMVQEQIMLEYVGLCIDQDKLRMARDGLHQYRLVAQHANVASLGKVVVGLLEHAEARLRTIKATERADGEQEIDNDQESPEILLMNDLHIDVRGSKSRQLYAVYRFLWETYKMILDIMRATPKLEKVYHDTARKAILFCKENDRVSEFKRLCDVLRGHYTFLYKVKNKPEMECMLKPELHIETRINQLIAACDMGLWKEAFNTVEDLYTLGIRDYITKTFQGSVSVLGQQKEKLLKWLAIFYEKLSLIFWVSDLHLFHALAVLRYVTHILMYKKKVAPEEIEYMCSKCVLAVLAIPDHSPSGNSDFISSSNTTTYEMQRRMSTLLGYNTIPTKESLHFALTNKNVLQLSDENTRKLYDLMEKNTSACMTLCVDVVPLLKVEKTDPSVKTPACLQQKGISFFGLLSLYYPKIKTVVFHKVLLKLTKVYASMTIDFFTKSICPPDFLEWNQAENEIVELVYQGICQVHLDYSSKVLYFNKTSSACNSISAIRLHLTNLGKNLYYAMRVLNPNESVQSDDERSLNLVSMRNGIEKERACLMKRTSEIYQRRQEHQEEQMRAEEERKKLELQQKINEEEAEKQRRAEVLKQMDDQRRKDERLKVKIETAQQMLDTIRKIGGNQCSKIIIKGKNLDEINVEDVMDGFVDYDDLEKAQEEQRARERIEIMKQRKAEIKRIDHFVRAVREHELALYEAWQKKVYEQDTKTLLEVQKMRESSYRADVEQMMQEKQAFKQVIKDKDEWVAEKMEMRRAAFEVERQKQLQYINQLLIRDKIQRARERRATNICSLETKRREDERLKLELEEQRKMEEEAQHRQKLMEQAEKQRAKELEIEKRLLSNNTRAPYAAPESSVSSRTIESGNDLDTLESWRQQPAPKKEEPAKTRGFRFFGRKSTANNDEVSWRK